jgi:hypothetical protein
MRGGTCRTPYRGHHITGIGFAVAIFHAPKAFHS